jgi:hypothetical protein
MPKQTDKKAIAPSFKTAAGERTYSILILQIEDDLEVMAKAMEIQEMDPTHTIVNLASIKLHAIGQALKIANEIDLMWHNYHMNTATQ